MEHAGQWRQEDNVPISLPQGNSSWGLWKSSLLPLLVLTVTPLIRLQKKKRSAEMWEYNEYWLCQCFSHTYTTQSQPAQIPITILLINIWILQKTPSSILPAFTLWNVILSKRAAPYAKHCPITWKWRNSWLSETSELFLFDDALEFCSSGQFFFWVVPKMQWIK